MTAHMVDKRLFIHYHVNNARHTSMTFNAFYFPFVFLAHYFCSHGIKKMKKNVFLIYTMHVSNREKYYQVQDK